MANRDTTLGVATSRSLGDGLRQSLPASTPKGPRQCPHTVTVSLSDKDSPSGGAEGRDSELGSGAAPQPANTRRPLDRCTARPPPPTMYSWMGSACSVWLIRRWVKFIRNGLPPASGKGCSVASKQLFCFARSPLLLSSLRRALDRSMLYPLLLLVRVIQNLTILEQDLLLESREQLRIGFEGHFDRKKLAPLV